MTTQAHASSQRAKGDLSSKARKLLSLDDVVMYAPKITSFKDTWISDEEVFHQDADSALLDSLYGFLNRKYRTPYDFKLLNNFNPSDPSNRKYFGECVALNISVGDKITGRLYKIVKEVETANGKQIYRATVSGSALMLLNYNKDYIVTKDEEKELKKHIGQWINKSCLKNDTDILKINFENINLSILVRVFARRALPEKLAGSFYIISFIFIFDDTMEDMHSIRDEELDHYKENVYKYVDLIIEGLKSLISSNSEILAQLESQELWKQLKETDKMLGTKFARAHQYILEIFKLYNKDEDAKYFIDATITYFLAAVKDLDSCKTSQQYLQVRGDDTALLLAIEVSLLAEGIIVPEKIRKDKLFQELEQCPILYHSIMNDIISLPKEHCRNYLLYKSRLLAEEGNHENPLQIAIEESFNELNNLRWQMIEISRKLEEKFGQEIIAILQFYERFFCYSMLWYTHPKTKRYDHGSRYKPLDSQLTYEYFSAKHVQ